MIIHPSKPEIIKDGLLAQQMMAGMDGGMQSIDGMGQFPFFGSGGGGGGPTTVQSVIATACCDLDATISDSYSGSGQTLSNIIASPYDGASQSDYNAVLGLTTGASSDDPTFNGTAGDSAAYFSVDGGDGFTIPVGGNALNTMHYANGSGKTWWVCICLYRAGGLTPWGRGWTSYNASTGIYLYNGSIYQNNFGTDSANLNISSDFPATGVNTFYVLSCSMDSTSNNVRAWKNTTTKSVYSKTWSNFVPSISASNFGIMCDARKHNTTESLGGNLSSGSKFYHFSMGSGFIDDSDVSALKTLLEARHGRTY